MPHRPLGTPSGTARLPRPGHTSHRGEPPEWLELDLASGPVMSVGQKHPAQTAPPPPPPPPPPPQPLPPPFHASNPVRSPGPSSPASRRGRGIAASRPGAPTPPRRSTRPRPRSSHGPQPDPSVRPLPLYSEQRGQRRPPRLLSPVFAPSVSARGAVTRRMPPARDRHWLHQTPLHAGLSGRRCSHGSRGPHAGRPTAEPPGSGCACGSGFPGRSERSPVLRASSVHCLDLSRAPRRAAAIRVSGRSGAAVRVPAPGRTLSGSASAEIGRAHV